MQREIGNNGYAKFGAGGGGGRGVNEVYYGQCEHGEDGEKALGSRVSAVNNHSKMP